MGARLRLITLLSLVANAIASGWGWALYHDKTCTGADFKTLSGNFGDCAAAPASPYGSAIYTCGAQGSLEAKLYGSTTNCAGSSSLQNLPAKLNGACFPQGGGVYAK